MYSFLIRVLKSLGHGPQSPLLAPLADPIVLSSKTFRCFSVSILCLYALSQFSCLSTLHHILSTLDGMTPAPSVNHYLPKRLLALWSCNSLSRLFDGTQMSPHQMGHF